MPTPHDIQLRWAVIDNQLQEISAFDHLEPHKRPPAFCPLCQRPVTMKLGTVRAYHCAHQPNDVCSATNPETALHLNMKFYIAQQLRQVDKLIIEERCWSCSNTRHQIKFADWDQVAVEYTLGKLYRPDVALLADGRSVGAIEVLVTHKVDDPKASYYESHNIEWIEVAGKESFYEGTYAWTADKPMPIQRSHPALQGWKCPDCLQREEDEKALQARWRQQQEQQKANAEQILYSRLVDFYYRSGKKYREWYFIKQIIKNGEVAQTILTTEGRNIIARQLGPTNEEKIQRLHRGFQEHVKAKGSGAAAVDWHMTWRKWQAGQKIHAKNFDRFPFRYEWDTKTRKWVQQLQDNW